MQAIIYQNGDGVAVIFPSPDSKLTLAEIIEKDTPQGASVIVVEAENLPDRHFREAWEFDAQQGPVVNVEKAKEVQRNLWREARAPKLLALDTAMIRALEDGDDVRRAAIVDEKQALRDVTETELTDDLEAIKNTWPAILNATPI